MEYDISSGNDIYETGKFFLEKAYEYGCNQGWYRAQDEELTRRQWDK